MVLLSKVALTSSRVRTAGVRPPLHISSIAAIAKSPSCHSPRLSQGVVSNPDHVHPGDPQDQAARAGQHIARGEQESPSPYDAALRAPDKKTDHTGYSGNPEGVGFVEQVGSAMSLGRKGEARPSAGEGMGAQEESVPPGFLANLKSKLGLGTTAGEAKQNRGGGVGVAGSWAPPFGGKPHESRRPYHSSAVLLVDRTTKGQAPGASRQPKEDTNAGQNAHLQHRVGKGPDKGKGNAGENPALPSHEVGKEKPAGRSQQRRSFSTSLLRLNAKGDAHTAESYFKDVDSAPPPSEKTYQVDGSNPTVQRPNEAISGDYHRAGPQTKEYATVDNNGKYDVPPSTGPEKDQKSSYGNTRRYYDPHASGSTVSKAEEGPQGASAGGRKPEHS